jgi:ABC-type dipeptide/oligopeptide/nickel transport system permease subunit
VALVAGTLTCLIGATLGLLAGFLRGWVDMVISRLIDIWMAFPPVLFSILLIAVLGPGLMSIIIAIVVIDWTRFARVVRAEAMAQGAMDYVASAQVAGAGLRHHADRNPAQRAADHRRAADAGDGHRRDRRGDPVLREPVDLDR